MTTKKCETSKIDPETPFDCWCLPCSDCVWFTSSNKCSHPDCHPDSNLHI